MSRIQRSILTIMHLIDEYTGYLQERGVRFASNGFPIPERDWYLTIHSENDFPENIVTYRERRSAKLVSSPSKTVLCFYCADQFIYPRLERMRDEFDAYRPFMGVIGADVTVTADMDLEWQRETLLLNQLFMCMLGVNGIKVVQNLRIGSPGTLEVLLDAPEGVLAASGTLGCAPTKPDDISYTVKLTALGVGGVLLYGKMDPVMESQISALGIPHRWYMDTHMQYKKHTTTS